MPTNKNAHLRYQILDRCFSDFTRKYEINDLLDEVNDALMDLYGTDVSVRQIRDDIKFLRDRVTYDAPIVAYPFDGKRCYYRYADRNFSIFNNELTTKEISTLTETIEMLGRFRGMPNNGWLEEVISSLEYRFGIKADSEKIVSFEQNEQLKGLEFLGELINSAINHQPLNIFYRTFSGKENQSVIHPYYIKQFNNRWFLFGMEESEHGNRIANRALDRIVKFTRADIAFIPNSMIDFDSFFKNIIGVTIQEGSKVEQVVLKFEAERFPYILSKPIHASQKVIDKDNHTIQISVRPNKELEAQIFSYGQQVEVLKPGWLRQQIAEKIAETYKKYFSMQKECTDES